MPRQAVIVEGSDAWRLLDELARESADMAALGVTERAARRRHDEQLAGAVARDMGASAPRVLLLALTLGDAWRAARPAELLSGRARIVSIPEVSP